MIWQTKKKRESVTDVDQRCGLRIYDDGTRDHEAKKILMTHENISDDIDIIRKPMDIQTELISSRDSVGEIRCSPLERPFTFTDQKNIRRWHTSTILDLFDKPVVSLLLFHEELHATRSREAAVVNRH